MPMLAFDSSDYPGSRNRNLRKGIPFVPALSQVDLATAIHESGHVCLSLVQGCDVLEAVIALDGSGATSRTPKTLPVESKGAIYMAGLAANQIAGNVKPLRSYRRDFNKLLKLARDAGMDDDEAYLLYGRSIGRARTILKDNWLGVLAVAKALIRKRSLRGDEIYQTFKEAIP